MIKIVVIDRNAISRNLLTTLLVNGDFEVVGDASNTSAGIAAMIKLRPQIVCIDLGVMEQEAWQSLEAIRRELPKSLIFMVSAQFESSTVERAAQYGVHGFIVKPFKEATVLTTIRKLILKIAREHQRG